MRQDLVDWMSQQHSTLELVDETLHLAIRYLDTFLNRRGAHPPRPPRANPPNPEFKISTQTRKPMRLKKERDTGDFLKKYQTDHSNRRRHRVLPRTQRRRI